MEIKHGMKIDHIKIRIVKKLAAYHATSLCPQVVAVSVQPMLLLKSSQNIICLGSSSVDLALLHSSSTCIYCDLSPGKVEACNE